MGTALFSNQGTKVQDFAKRSNPQGPEFCFLAEASISCRVETHAKTWFEITPSAQSSPRKARGKTNGIPVAEFA